MATNESTPDQDDIQVRLKNANEECQRLREENNRHRDMLGMDYMRLPAIAGTVPLLSKVTGY
jgi:hypothetical protein